MNKNLLVAYASKYGATREIAEKIGEVIGKAGWQVKVLPVDGVRDLNTYTAIILGSAVYIGKWQKEAMKFLQANEKTLADRPVWLFSSGPTGEGDPVELLEGWRLPANMHATVERIRPREVVVFHGNIDPEKVNFIEKQAVKSLKKPFGDFRDWDAITAWTNTIVIALNSSNPRQ